MGKFLSDSGFEDIVFQANLCTSGSLRGVISGTHYNKAWIVHTGKTIESKIDNFSALFKVIKR